ncbi:DUF1993 domain-containing protein [Alteraurantiacibacter palmitatis]|uniref:DUF1993 domain-containing protein n=1 Tax=Alteraurantiacibacter palmitatis TaxID=2054628 RepID=A0ABV7E3Z1_9SPHN
MTPASLLLPTYADMLSALAAWLDKAEREVGPDQADALMRARLAPDMFPLATQVRFACVQALEGVHRLARQDFPPLVQALLDEGRGASDNPGTISEARARIAQTRDLAAKAAADIPAETDPQAPLEHRLPIGIVFDLTVEQYVRDWALPQFYFHLMAAYAILRAAGVPLGKADYVQHMFAYVRPGTMPPAG